MNKTQEHDQKIEGRLDEEAGSDEHKQGSSEYTNLGGNNVGASMRVSQRSFKLGGEQKDCCCINIYINSNVQGVSNSVLYGSQVEMREPGIRLYFEDFKVDRSTTPTNNMSRLGFWFCLLLLLLAFLVFLISMLFSTRIFIVIGSQTTPHFVP
ncbi:hypothetical protein K1719_032235 [Acacia pycnantha]|nr:hypothetical protein K1719_032235 [Acacia pycnantha]